MQFAGRGAADRARAACGRRATLLILAAVAPPDLPPDCALLDAKALARTGPISVSAGPDGAVVDTVRARSGQRLWMRAGAAPPMPASVLLTAGNEQQPRAAPD